MIIELNNVTNRIRIVLPALIAMQLTIPSTGMADNLAIPTIENELNTVLPDGGTYSSPEWDNKYKFSHACAYAMEKANRHHKIEVYYEMQNVMLKVLTRENKASKVTKSSAYKEVIDWVKADAWAGYDGYVQNICYPNIFNAREIIKEENFKLLTESGKKASIVNKNKKAKKEEYDNLQQSVRAGAICHYLAKKTYSPTTKLWKDYHKTSQQLLIAYGETVKFNLSSDSVMLEGEMIKSEVGSYHGSYDTRCGNWLVGMTNELKEFKQKLKTQ